MPCLDTRRNGGRENTARLGPSKPIPHRHLGSATEGKIRHRFRSAGPDFDWLLYLVGAHCQPAEHISQPSSMIRRIFPNGFVDSLPFCPLPPEPKPCG